MTISPEWASLWLWLIWYVTWVVAAFWASRAIARPRLDGTVLHRIVTGVGVVLLFWLPGRPLWLAPPMVGWALCGVILAAFAFCWWARLHLGTLWSGLVTVKAGHHIVDTGPYRIVRHPIYTGVIFAALATALIRAGPGALIGGALIGIGFWMTARVEEGFLRQQLGPDAYDAYARRTPMIIPWLGPFGGKP